MRVKPSALLLSALVAAGLFASPVLAKNPSAFLCVAGDISYIFAMDAKHPDTADMEISAGETADPDTARTDSLNGYWNAESFFYARDNLRFFGKDHVAFLEDNGDEPRLCQPYVESGQNGDLNIAGQSWGGKVRGGPGMTFDQTDSLTEGQPVKLLRNSGVTFNGYDWFEIQYDGKTGFQWGGILCTDSADVAGTFSPCSQ